MAHEIETPAGASPGTRSPQCVTCHTPMRHSCTDEQESGFELQVYQCVTCGSTQSIEMAAAENLMN